MTAPHPTDRRLADFVDGRLSADDAADTRTHVSGCGRCQQRLGTVDDEPPIASVPITEVASGAALSAPSTWEEREADPIAGDVWRVAWDDINELAVVRAIDPRNLRLSVLPLTEPEAADQWSLLTEIAIGAVQLPVAVSAAHEVSIPWCVLDARVGRVAADTIADLDELRRLFRTGAEPSDAYAVGDSVWSRLDERAEHLDELGERFQLLANVDWAPESQVEVAQAQALPAYDQLRESGLPASRILDIRRGAALTPGEVERIASATGHRLESSGTVVSLDLRRWLDKPQWRPALRRRASQRGLSEAEERRVVVAEVTQPIAARGTAGKAVDWDVLLHQLLDD